MFYESDVCYQTKLVTKLVKDAFFEAVAKNGYVLLSANRFPRENSQGVYITPEWYSVRRIFFSFLYLSFILFIIVEQLRREKEIRRGWYA